jgi:iron complex outermembrane receptor protein
LLSPDFYAGADIKPSGLLDYSIKISYAKNSKIPSLNDMYWSPGGNPQLLNESGYVTEAGIYMNNEINRSIRLINNLTFFRNHISDMIQWYPGEFSYWQAGNINDLISYGIEANIGILYKLHFFSAGINSGYSRTVAHLTDAPLSDATGKKPQLIYLPADQFNLVIKSGWKQLFSSFRFDFTGKRYLTSDNSVYLPQYFIGDAEIGMRIISKRTVSEIKLIAENLFDAAYQNMAYYPMPGRSYMISLIFQYKK